MVPPGDLLPVSLAESLRVEAVLGEGSHGRVLRVWQEALGRSAVLKLLKTEAEAGLVGDLAKRFHQEARVLASLRHPHLPVVLDHGVEDGVAFLLLEDTRGQSLEHILEDGPLSPGEVTLLLQQCLGAVAHLHEQGWIHRDLKPGNLLRGEDDNWSLLDFGLVRALSREQSLTATGLILGTPAYLSPQAARGEEPSPGDDLYALGVVSYEALAGGNPFAGGTLAEVLRRHQELRPAPLSSLVTGVPPSLGRLVERLLSRDQALRPGAREALDVLLEIGEGPPSSVPLPGGTPGDTQIACRGGDRPRVAGTPDSLAAPTQVSVAPGVAPSSGPTGLRRSWLGFLLAIVAGAGIGSLGTGEAPVAVLPTASPLPPREENLSSGGASRIALIEALARRFQFVAESLPRDPLEWPELYRRLPEMEALELRIGRDEAPWGEHERELLVDLGRDFSSMGLWDPTRGWLRLEPARGAVTISESRSLPPWFQGQSFTRWTGTAVTAYLEALEGHRRIYQGAKQILAGQGTRLSFPTFFQRSLESSRFVHLGTERFPLAPLFRLHWGSGPEERRALMRFQDEALVSAGIAWRAVARALARGEQTENRILDVLLRRFRDVAVLQVSPDLLSPIEPWILGAREAPRSALLRFLDLQRRTEILGPVDRAPRLPREHWRDLARRAIGLESQARGLLFRAQLVLTLLAHREVVRVAPGLDLVLLRELRPRMRVVPPRRQALLLHALARARNAPRPDPLDEEVARFPPEVQRALEKIREERGSLGLSGF